MGAMSAPGGLGAFTRMLRKNKTARKMVQNKVSGAKQQMSAVHARYLKLMHRKRKRIVRG